MDWFKINKINIIHLKKIDAVKFLFYAKKIYFKTLDDGKSYAYLYYIFNEQNETYVVLLMYYIL